MPLPVLETPRLILRPPEAADIDAWTAMMSDEEVARFIGGKMNRHLAWRAVCAMRGSWELFGFAMFSVIEKETGNWIGRLGPWVPADWPGPEVGWGLARSTWGKGYATEGAAAAIDWSFDNLGWTDVIHCIDPQNLNSARVAERLGSRRLRKAFAPAPFDQVEMDVWGQSREEWRVNRGRFSSSLPA